MLGKTVYSQFGVSEKTLYLKLILTPGLYHVVLADENGRRISKMVVE